MKNYIEGGFTEATTEQIERELEQLRTQFNEALTKLEEMFRELLEGPTEMVL